MRKLFTKSFVYFSLFLFLIFITNSVSASETTKCKDSDKCGYTFVLDRNTTYLPTELGFKSEMSYTRKEEENDYQMELSFTLPLWILSSFTEYPVLEFVNCDVSSQLHYKKSNIRTLPFTHLTCEVKKDLINPEFFIEGTIHFYSTREVHRDESGFFKCLVSDITNQSLGVHTTEVIDLKVFEKLDSCIDKSGGQTKDCYRQYGYFKGGLSYVSR